MQTRQTSEHRVKSTNAPKFTTLHLFHCEQKLKLLPPSCILSPCLNIKCFSELLQLLLSLFIIISTSSPLFQPFLSHPLFIFFNLIFLPFHFSFLFFFHFLSIFLLLNPFICLQSHKVIPLCRDIINNVKLLAGLVITSFWKIICYG